MLIISNPENCFSKEPDEEMTYSKEHKLIVEQIETSKTCFHFQKRSNRSFNVDTKREEAAEEEVHDEFYKIVIFVDRSLFP